MTETPVVAVQAAEKHWGTAVGLAPFSMHLNRGELVVLQGRSGSGKSTLLALLAGWCSVDRGSIVRNGEWAVGERWRTWASTAIVPQVLGLADELSVWENLEHVLRLRGQRPAACRPLVEATLTALDLGEQARRLPREISLGQQQRVAVGRATIASPAVLLADEPTCHQDPTHTDVILRALRAVADAGGAVLVASHEPAVAAASDRIVSIES